MTSPVPAVIRIGTLRICGSGLSPAEARRLADHLPAALTRAFSGWPDNAAQRVRGLSHAERQADRVAARVLDAARRRIRAERGQS